MNIGNITALLHKHSLLNGSTQTLLVLGVCSCTLNIYFLPRKKMPNCGSSLCAWIVDTLCIAASGAAAPLWTEASWASSRGCLLPNYIHPPAPPCCLLQLILLKFAPTDQNQIRPCLDWPTECDSSVLKLFHFYATALLHYWSWLPFKRYHITL